jgi:hypothetical protein
MNDNLTTNAPNEAESPAFLLGAVIRRFLCWLGIHRYKWTLVFTKREFRHCKGIEHIGHDLEPHWHDGRECKFCKKKQYFWYWITTCGWKNVL